MQGPLLCTLAEMKQDKSIKVELERDTDEEDGMSFLCSKLCIRDGSVSEWPWQFEKVPS